MTDSTPKADTVMFTAFTIDRFLGLVFLSSTYTVTMPTRTYVISGDSDLGKNHVLLYRVSVNVSFGPHVYNRDINFGIWAVIGDGESGMKG